MRYTQTHTHKDKEKKAIKTYDTVATAQYCQHYKTSLKAVKS